MYYFAHLVVVFGSGTRKTTIFAVILDEKSARTFNTTSACQVQIIVRFEKYYFINGYQTGNVYSCIINCFYGRSFRVLNS